jgi:hypothetical protein
MAYEQNSDPSCGAARLMGLRVAVDWSLASLHDGTAISWEFKLDAIPQGYEDHRS